jgi:integrase
MRARRDKGDGSIIERIRGGKVQYVARLTVPREVAPTGRLERVRGTKRAARAALAELRRELEAGRLAAGARQPLATYLDGWLAQVVRPWLAPKTYASYEQLVRVHVVPRLGAVPLGELTPRHARLLLNDLLAGGKSPRTVSHVHAVLRNALNRAVRDGLLPANPAARVEAPRVRLREVAPLSVEQARRFLGAVAGHRLEAVYRVAIAVGLREGELCGLRWRDVDLEAGRLAVRWTLGRVLDPDAAPGRPRTRLVVGQPKSARSRRVILLPAASIAVLRAHRERQATERRLAGDRWREHGLAFPSSLGTPLEPRNLLRHFQTTCAALGLRPPDRPRFTIHDLRHTAASLLLAQGVPLRVVMEILGHSQIGVTANFYSHILPEQQIDAAERMDALLRRLDAPAVGAARADGDDGGGDRVSGEVAGPGESDGGAAGGGQGAPA